MMVLRRLRKEARVLVTPELASGSLSRIEDTEAEGFVELLGKEISLEAFDEALTKLMALMPRYDTALDARAAIDLHRTLGLTRRDAADPGIWRYLTVVHRPDFIRHRWENSSWATMRSRFWSMGTRPDSNTLARLWWIAELTRVDGSFELTERVLRRQTLANAIFVRSLSGYLPAVRAAVEMLDSAPSEVVERVMLQLSRVLGTVPLESRSYEELVELIGAFRELEG